MIIIVESGQTLMDLAIQYYGNPSAILELANDNNLSISDEVQAGTPLLVRDTKPETAISLFSDYLNENGTVVVSKQADTSQSVLGTNDDEILIDNDDNGLEDA